MKKLFVFLTTFYLLSCNPYEQYNSTHLYIQAEVQPDSALIAANVQMVFLAGKVYTDSICFQLNSGLKIHSLAAQELEYYRFNETGAGKLVLYIEEIINPGEAIQISLSYSGLLDQQVIQKLDSSMLWLPVNEDSRPFTYQAKFSLPGKWRITDPDPGRGKHGKWLIESGELQENLEVKFTQD